uniref:Uncharacterized protein n=1 Tax=viral metagenome TaxID=1070528 RepID=A0A6C0ED37_9ZZZZ
MESYLENCTNKDTFVYDPSYDKHYALFSNFEKWMECHKESLVLDNIKKGLVECKTIDKFTDQLDRKDLIYFSDQAVSYLDPELNRKNTMTLHYEYPKFKNIEKAENDIKNFIENNLELDYKYGIETFVPMFVPYVTDKKTSPMLFLVTHNPNEINDFISNLFGDYCGMPYHYINLDSLKKTKFVLMQYESNDVLFRNSNEWKKAEKLIKNNIKIIFVGKKDPVLTIFDDEILKIINVHHCIENKLVKTKITKENKITRVLSIIMWYILTKLQHKDQEIYEPTEEIRFNIGMYDYILKAVMGSKVENIKDEFNERCIANGLPTLLNDAYLEYVMNYYVMNSYFVTPFDNCDCDMCDAIDKFEMNDHVSKKQRM